jgi:hypothetical protein
MFRQVFRSSATTTAMAAGAALTGATFVGSSLNTDKSVTQCSDNTVIAKLDELARKVSNIETVIGGRQGSVPSQRAKHGIDIVLGAQWGDEGKGKLVDILSQVSL